MLMGIKAAAYPTPTQRETLSQWMGCSRFVWNAKYDENKYLTRFARKYLPVNTYAPIDQSYSQYKNPEISPWLSKCPSQILRNSCSNWYATYMKFLKGECGKPQRKKKCNGGSIHLTKELFRFEFIDGEWQLFVGTKTNNIGFLKIKVHRQFTKLPNSIRIKKKAGRYWVGFCFDDPVDESQLQSNSEHLDYLRGSSRAFLEAHTIGVDRGVVRPVQAGSRVFDLTAEQKRRKASKERYIKKAQRRLARQEQKGTKRRARTKQKIAKAFSKITNVREDFCHKTSKAIVHDIKTKIIVLEDLRTQNMTRRSIAKKGLNGNYEKNGARRKAGLNRSILDKGWHKLETFTRYKAYRAGKAFFKISAHHTSQECAACNRTHPENRKTQSEFLCVFCGHRDNADHNAQLVIKKRAIDLILDSGSELSARGVLRLAVGGKSQCKTQRANASCAVAKKRQKRREKVVEA